MKFYYCYVILTIATLSCSSTRFGVVNAASASAPASASDSGSYFVCPCAPSTYEFTLDFSLTCTSGNSILGDGVAETECSVSPFEVNSSVNPVVSDFAPETVQFIEIIEFDQYNSILKEEMIEGDFKDGDTFSFISNAGRGVNIPKRIQFSILGKNKDGQGLINIYIITFTNSCEAFPVLSDGQSVGWTRFVSIFYIAKECGLSYQVLIL